MGGAEAFGRAGDEDEGDVGKFVTEVRELGEEMATYAAGSWDSSDYVVGGVFANAEKERATGW